MRMETQSRENVVDKGNRECILGTGGRRMESKKLKKPENVGGTEEGQNSGKKGRKC